MEEKYLFKEVQNSWRIKLLFFAIILTISLAFYFEWGSHPISLASFIVLSIFLAVIGFIFSKLTLELTSTELRAHFALKFISQKVLIKEIDFKTLKVEKTPLIYGVGLRLTPKGTLYNTKPGKAIWLKSIHKKTFFVGSDRAEELKAILLKLKSNF